MHTRNIDAVSYVFLRMLRGSVLGFLLLGSFAFAAAPALAAGPAASESPAGSNYSRNWAGYVAEGATYTGISGTWTIPTVPAASTAAADAAWVGIGGVTNTDLIQAGTQALTQNGSVSYQAWYETLPNELTPVPLSVHSGDVISVLLTDEGNDTWLITIADGTTGEHYSTTVSYHSSLSTAEWIEEMPTDQYGLIPLDQFGSVSFNGATAVVNGTTRSANAAGAEPLSMTTAGGTLLASPSALGVDGESFTITRASGTASVVPSTTTHYRTFTRHGQGPESVTFTSGGSGDGAVRYYSFSSSGATSFNRTYTFQNGSFVVHVSMGN